METIIIFLISMIVITIIVLKIHDKSDSENYIDSLDLPYYGGFEEQMSFFNQFKKMDVKEFLMKDINNDEE